MTGSSLPKNLVLIHFHPLEMYPPACNILNYLSQNLKEFNISAFTTKNTHKDQFSVTGLKIYRVPGIGRSENFILRVFKYIRFNLFFLFKIFTIKPEIIIYFETLSAFPALIYHKFSIRKPKLFVHYHEYNTIEELNNSMMLNKLFYKLEKQLFPEFSWISHTNKNRMDLFLKDNPNVKLSSTNILPNYPPRSWCLLKKESKNRQELTKFIYVGSVSMETMFFREFFEWVAEKKGKVIFDIYSHHIPGEIKEFLKDMQCPFIQLKNGLPYERLPAVLKDYDVGLILYKGHILNYIYNAPNKLFEYLACGLDVWFPKEMLGMYEHITENTYPKVLKIDYKNLDNLDLERALDPEGLKKKDSEFFYESELTKLAAEIIR